MIHSMDIYKLKRFHVTFKNAKFKYYNKKVAFLLCHCVNHFLSLCFSFFPLSLMFGVVNSLSLCLIFFLTLFLNFVSCHFCPLFCLIISSSLGYLVGLFVPLCASSLISFDPCSAIFPSVTFLFFALWILNIRLWIGFLVLDCFPVIIVYYLCLFKSLLLISFFFYLNH